MIGLVLVTHGRLAEEFVAATEHVVGPQPGTRAICIGPDDDMEQRRRDILDAIAATDEGHGVIVLTDMFGGTPSNLAISVMDKANVEVIAGVNLPMLIKLASERAGKRPAPRRGLCAGGRPHLYPRRRPAARGRQGVSGAAQAPGEGSPDEGSRRHTCLIGNRRGLHARAAARFVKAAARFDAEVGRLLQRHAGLGPLDPGADDAGGAAGQRDRDRDCGQGGCRGARGARPAGGRRLR